MAKEGLNKKREILIRAYVGFLFIAALGIAIICKVGYIQIAKGAYYRSLADSLTIFPKTIAAERGNIYATDGRLLATSIPVFDLHIDFGADGLKDSVYRKNVDSVCLLLSKKYPEKSFEDYKRAFNANRQKRNGYFLLRKNASFRDVMEMKKWPWFRLTRNKSGLIIESKDLRDHPFGDVALRTLGVDENLDGIYSSGVELKYQTALAGVEGVKLFRKLSGGASKPLNNDDEIASKPGKDIYTTIDVNFQDVAHDALRRALIKHQADHGTVVLMEVATGKIRAIANLGRKDSTTYKELLNYAVGEAAEPGSTFKIATVAALMEDGLANASTPVNVGNGTFTIKGLTIKDHEAPPSPTISLQRAIEISSNVAVAKLAYANYAINQSKFYNHLKNYGFTEPIDFEVSGKVMPTIAKPNKWSGVSAAYLAHGYELKVTPLHTLQFINAIANNGLMVKPVLLEKIGEESVVDSMQQIHTRRIMDEKYAKEIQQILHGVVENGTAMNLKTDYLDIAGKTGTAVIANKGYKGDKKYQASFVGYFPASNPQYTMIVVINSPSTGGYYGNVVAGSIFREVADKVYSLSLDMKQPINQHPTKTQLSNIGVKSTGKFVEQLYSFFGVKMNPIEEEWVSATTDNGRLQLAALNVSAKQVPNVTGMGLRDAIYLLESKGLAVEFSGSGLVSSQSIAAGSEFYKGQKIKLTLGK